MTFEEAENFKWNPFDLTKVCLFNTIIIIWLILKQNIEKEFIYVFNCLFTDTLYNFRTLK